MISQHKKIIQILIFLFFFTLLNCQLRWNNEDFLFQPLPKSIQVFGSRDSLGGHPNIAYYVTVDLKKPDVILKTDTSYRRGLKPSDYFIRNNKPVLVVNTSFFDKDYKNLNIVLSEKKMLAGNVLSIYDKNDNKYDYFTRSSLGIDNENKADVAWVQTDLTTGSVYEFEEPLKISSKSNYTEWQDITKYLLKPSGIKYKKWNKVTAVGGGPNLVSEGKINITNNEEKLFTGNKINDKHPRTAIGYTTDNRLIILVVQGRTPGVAHGATLTELAEIMIQLGCIEAINLDGGGSSCLLINGKETIKPSDLTGQRPVPSVLMINTVSSMLND